MFLTADWRWLAIFNYVVDRTVLQPFVPPGLELDDEDGRAYVSVVGFMFYRTRVRGLWIPFHSRFPELNLRFYVRRDAPDGLQRGVTFIRELVSLPAVAWIARGLYNEPYRVVRLRSNLIFRSEAIPDLGPLEPPIPSDSHPDTPPVEATYFWRQHRRDHRMTIRPHGTGRTVEPHSHEAFITERPWGFTPQPRGNTMQYHVHHPPWTIFPAREAILDVDVARVWGPQFAEPLNGPPYSAFLAAGSAVRVSPGSSLRPTHP